MNRLRSEVASPADSSLLGSLYGNGKASGESGGLSGINMRAGMDDSAMLEELQRRRVRIDAAAKKEEAMNMLRESDQMARWADQTNNNNKASMNESSMDFNTNQSGMNGGGLGGNRSNAAMGFMGMPALGASGNLDNMNSNNLDSMTTSSLLSKLASGNAKMSDQLFMQGAANFGNNSSMANSIMNMNNNMGSANDSMGDSSGQLSISNNALGQQSLNQIREQFNYDMP